jgi:opacity protein-like surface antigen
MLRKTTLTALSLLTLATPALAESQRWYAGISAGQSRTSHDLVSNREATLVNVVSVQSEQDLTDGAWKVFAGFRFSDMLAVELDYADLGRQRVLTHVVGGDPPLPSSFELRHRISGFGADLVVSIPFRERYSIFGRVSAFQSRLEAEAALGGNIVFSNGLPGETRRGTTRNETVLRYGLGGEWGFLRNAALRLEWERYNKIGKAFAIGGSGTTGEADSDFVSLGVLMRF